MSIPVLHFERTNYFVCVENLTGFSLVLLKGANTFKSERIVWRDEADKNNMSVTSVFRYLQGKAVFFFLFFFSAYTLCFFQPVFCSRLCFAIKPFGVFPSSPVSALALVTLSVFECFQKAWNIIIKQSCVPINVNSWSFWRHSSKMAYWCNCAARRMLLAHT